MTDFTPCRVDVGRVGVWVSGRALGDHAGELVDEVVAVRGEEAAGQRGNAAGASSCDSLQGPQCVEIGFKSSKRLLPAHCR